METLVNSSIFPAYLYNHSRLDDYRYIFNRTTVNETLNVLRQEDVVNIPSMDMMGIWDHGCLTARQCTPFHLPVDIDAIRKNFRSPQHTPRTPAEIAAIDFEPVDRFLLGTVLQRCNHNIRFDLFFPPLSLWWFAGQNQQQFDYQLYMLRHVVGKTAMCNNVRVFAFNDEAWIAGDLAHYHDQRHFVGDVPRYIIESMASGKHVINPENVDAYETRFINAVNHYQPWASTEEQMRQNARY